MALTTAFSMKILQSRSLNFLSLSFLVAIAVALFSFTTDPSVLETILKKLKQYHAERPQEKLYLHLDKPFYAAGDNVWFKAYLMEASLHSLDSQSRVVYVELIDETKTVFKRQMLFADGGLTFGDFQLPDTLQEGNYAIRAYTNYMKNAGEDFFFTKEFSVLNPLRKHPASTAAFAADSLELQFFPEGGNLVACGFNRVAFKALSPDGRGIDIEGTIVDDNNAVVTSFKSQHKGMGVFRINPVAGRKYTARITKPYAVNYAYQLPVVHEKGYSMQVDASAKNIKVIVFTNSDKPTSGDHTIHIVVQSRGNAYYAQPGVIKDNAFFTLIPKSKFPDGISQITVFDSEGRPVAERLIHQNNNETINLQVETDTSSYGKRKMVTVLVDALYRNNTPAAGSFSIAVYDEGLIKNVQEYPLSITNYLSLTSDLKGHIEDPGYYFKDSLAETRRNLDLLMMVNGWRRFTWTDVLEYTSKEQVYKRERGIPISGKVLKMGGKQPPAGSVLKVLTMDGAVVRLKPDSVGNFYTDSLLYYDSMTLVFQTENKKGKKQPYKFSLDPAALPPSFPQRFTSFLAFDATPFLEQKADEKLIENSSKVKVLDEAKVTAKRDTPDPRLLNPGGPSGRVVDVQKDLGGGLGYASINQMLYARVAGLNVIDGGWQIRGKPVVFAVNNMQVTTDFVNAISPTDVDLIEVLFNSVQYGGQHVISIILRDGSSVRDYEVVGVNQVKTRGFYQAREFYSPNYDVNDNRHSLEDKRTTLFWEPMMMTDLEGRAAVAFFTGDVPSRYRVVIEGVTADGYPGTASTTFEVK